MSDTTWKISHDYGERKGKNVNAPICAYIMCGYSRASNRSEEAHAEDATRKATKERKGNAEQLGTPLKWRSPDFAVSNWRKPFRSKLAPSNANGF